MSNDSDKKQLFHTCLNRLFFANNQESKKETQRERDKVYTSETGSSRVSGERVSGAAKTLFVNEMEGLLVRREEPMQPWVDEDGLSKGSRESFCLVEEEGLEKEGNTNEVTEETAIEFQNRGSILSSSSSSSEALQGCCFSLPQLRSRGLSTIQNLFFYWWTLKPT